MPEFPFRAKSFPASNTEELQEMLDRALSRILTLIQAYNPGFDLSHLGAETLADFVRRVKEGELDLSRDSKEEQLALKLALFLMRNGLYDWKEGLMFELDLSPEDQEKLDACYGRILTEKAADRNVTIRNFLELIFILFPEFEYLTEYRLRLNAILTPEESEKNISVPKTFSELCDLITICLHQGVAINFLTLLQDEFLDNQLIDEDDQATESIYFSEATQLRLTHYFNQALILEAHLRGIDEKEEVMEPDGESINLEASFKTTNRLLQVARNMLEAILKEKNS